MQEIERLRCFTRITGLNSLSDTVTHTDELHLRRSGRHRRQSEQKNYEKSNRPSPHLQHNVLPLLNDGTPPKENRRHSTVVRYLIQPFAESQRPAPANTPKQSRCPFHLAGYHFGAAFHQPLP